MGIKEFLIQNYIWIIVIIIITIITIIGFLADKKKGGKKKETPVPVTPNVNNQPINNQGQIQYQAPVQMETNQMNNNLNNNWGVNYNNMNTSINPINQMNNISNNIPTPVSSIPQPVENLVRNVETETMYQPLSEQSSAFRGQPVQNFPYMQNSINPELNQVNSIPTSVENTTNLIGATPQETISQPVILGPLMQGQTQPELPTYNNIQTPMQVVENNNSGVMANFIPNNITTPQPVNPIPTPQPVMPQSIMPGPMMQEGYNQPQMMQPNLGQPVQQKNPNIPIGQPTGSSVSAPQPVSFVYGPQNNQNM